LKEIKAERVQNRTAQYIRRCRIKAYAAALVGEPRDSEFFLLCVRNAEGRDHKMEQAQRDLISEPLHSL